MKGFKEVVENSWKEPITGTAMYILWNKLQRLKPALSQFSNNVSHLRAQVQKAINALEEAQNSLSLNRMDSDCINIVKTMTANLIHWNDLENNMMQQRAKLEWIRKVDCNITYYYATVKAKSQQRIMDVLHQEDGIVITGQGDIQTEVMNFYKGFMGSKERQIKCEH